MRVVVDKEARCRAPGRRGIDGVGVAAGALVGLEDLDAEARRQEVGGAEAGDPAADDRDPHHPAFVGVRILVRSRYLGGPWRSWTKPDKIDQAVGTVRPSTSRLSQVVTLVAVVVPPLGLISAMGLLWGVGFHWIDVALFLGFYVVCAFGTTIGFHRYFTHRGFEARAPVNASSWRCSAA